MRKLLVFICILFFGNLSGQDTISVMYYNILNFPNPSNSNSQGNDAARAIAFREIVEESDTDIVMVQELKNSTGADLLLTELNNNSQGKVFSRAPTFTSYGGLGNMLFYNSNLSNLVQQVEVPRNNSDTSPDGTVFIAPRANSYYELELFSPSNPADKDTIHFFAAHFKSSNGGGTDSSIADKDWRVLSVKDMLDYIDNNIDPNSNVVAGGDFNFYGYQPSIEPAYDSLMNNTGYPFQFLDALGPWTREDSSPSNVCKYTQSTRTTQSEYGNNGATSGLDDRFDFILFSDAINTGGFKTKYITSSYESYANPKVYNGNALEGNSPVENQVHAMSDHYPVVMQLEFNFSTICLINGITANNGSCINGDYHFDVAFNAGNTSGSYEVIDVTNGNTVLATGNSSPISVILPNINSNTPFSIQVRDVNDITCTSSSLSITPIDCSTVCAITIDTVMAACQANDFYDVTVCFQYQNPSTPDVNVIIDGQTFGPYIYPNTSPGCITIPAVELGILGNSTPNLNARVEETGSGGPVNGEPFISEIHYDNNSLDVEEFVEITAPTNTDLSNYQLEFYNGLNGEVYKTEGLTGITPNDANGCGAIDFLISGIQNGPDAIALIKLFPAPTVLEFISYEGSFVAVDGNAAGLTSTDILVSESSSSAIGESLQLTDTGWMGPIVETPSVINTGLTSCGNTGSSACFDVYTFDEPDYLTNMCNIVINQITPTCTPNENYDLEICFNYVDPLSTDVNIYVGGVFQGLYPYPAVSGDCITISELTLGLLGDGTLDMEVKIEDALSSTNPPSEPFISEIHYDNSGSDQGEFLEISGPNGTDLSNYQLVAYDNDGLMDDDDILIGILGDDGLGCGSAAFTKSDLSSQYFENGPDAIALINTTTSTVVDFISYEGTITAQDGPANGITSTDIGVAESSSTPIGASLQKTDAAWVEDTNDSPGVFNSALSSCGNAGILCEVTGLYNEPDCSPCPNDRTENGFPIDNGLYQASNAINSSGTVSNNGNVTFDAGMEIILLPDFTVPLGAEFIGIIGGCN